MRWRLSRGRSDRVSVAWLKEQARQTQKVEFEGVSIRWPIQKLQNESPLFQRAIVQQRRA